MLRAIIVTHFEPSRGQSLRNAADTGNIVAHKINIKLEIYQPLTFQCSVIRSLANNNGTIESHVNNNHQMT